MLTREPAPSSSTSRRQSLPLPANDTPRRGPGRPRKSGSVKPATAATNGHVAGEEIPERPPSAQLSSRSAGNDKGKGRDKDSSSLTHASSRVASPSSAANLHAQESRVSRTGRKSGADTPPSSRAQRQQKTLDDYVMTAADDPAPSSQNPRATEAAYPSPPVSDERQELAMSLKRTSSGARSGRESASNDTKIPDIADEARSLIAATKTKAEREDRSERKRRDREEGGNLRELEGATARSSRGEPIPDGQERRERPDRRVDRHETLDSRHQEHETQGPGQLWSGEIHGHELRGSAAGSGPTRDRRDADRERRRDSRSSRRRDSVSGYDEVTRFDSRLDPRVDPRMDPRMERDARDRHLPDPRVNGHFIHSQPPPGVPFPPSYNYGQSHQPGSSQYGYQPGFYPPPIAPAPPPHVLPPHSGNPNYSYGPSLASPRERHGGLGYDISPRVPQDEWAYRSGPSGYPPPSRGPTAPAAPPPHLASSSRRMSVQSVTQLSPINPIPHQHLPPIHTSPSTHPAPLRANFERDERHASRGSSRGGTRGSRRGDREYQDRESREHYATVADDSHVSRNDQAGEERRRERQYQLEREREPAQPQYTSVVPTPFPTGPHYHAPDPRPPKLDPRHPAIVLAPLGNQLPLPTSKAELPFAKDHARGYEGLDPNLEDNARGFVENVKVS